MNNTKCIHTGKLNLLFLCVLLLFQCLPAQEKLLPVFHFNRLTTANGLPTNEIRSNVVRDQMGFVWIPTINGLVLYDGYSCKVHRNRPGDTTSISSNYLMSVYIDKKNRLWMGTWDAGLTVFDPALDKFINIYPQKNNSAWLFINSIFDIKEDKSGNVWIMGTEGEVASVNMSELVGISNPDSLLRNIRFKNYRPVPAGIRIWDIESWGDNNAIISTGIGFLVIDPVSGTISRPELISTDGFKLDTVMNVALFRENMSVLWMGTHSHDIFRYDERNGILKHFPPKSRDGQELHTEIHHIQMDGFGNLWIGTNSGFEVFDTSSGMYCDYLLTPPAGLSHEGIPTKKMSLDNTGTFWLAAGKSGIYFLRRESQLFKHYGLRDTARKALEMGSIVHWNDGSLWIGASGKIVNIDPVTLQVRRIIDVLKGERPSYLYAAENDAYTDGSKFIWYGTWGLGIYKIDPSTGHVANYRVATQIPSKQNICWSLDGNGGDTVWIAGNYDGLLLFNTRTGRYIMPNDTALSRLRNVAHVMSDRSGIVWISDQKFGLFRVTSSGRVIDHFEHNIHDSNSIAFTNVRDTYEDAQGRIWIGGASIDLWQPETRSFKHYPNELFEQTYLVNPIVSDLQDRLWIRTNGIGLHILDPATGTYTNYTYSDGLCADIKGMALSDDGRVFVVGNNGLSIVHPDSLQREYRVPPVVLSRLTVNDTTSISSQIIAKTKSLDLPYIQNVLEFEFAAIDPGVTHMIRYCYRLEGLEDSWINSNNRRFVRYPGLSPGKYVFRVKAINKFGRWPDQELALSISIAPPWWRTWWAYTLYGFLLVGLMIVGYRIRLRQIYLKQHADMEHFQAERLAEVDKLKSRFFSNISHEFRTPLTLILGPIEQAIEKVQDTTIKQKLNLIKDNTKKLYGLVNQLLDFSRIESGTMKLQVSCGDLVKFLRRTVMSFESWAERKKINLEFISEKELVEGFFDADKLEKIINNLMSNALKFTPEGGKVDVTLSPVPSPTVGEGCPDTSRDEVRVIITDTGPGISSEHLPHIFDRFYRVDETHTTEGTGIGLALTKELVDLHHGTITADSTPGKGSVFTLILPIDKSNYTPDEITESQPLRDEQLDSVVPSDNSKQASTKKPSEGKPIVLIVEDNADLRTYICEYMDEDYTVNEAPNGKIGYEIATEIVPDIVISDVMMPEMDGMELCTALKQDVRTSHIPVILLTARASSDSKIEGLEIGADDYVTKPFDSKELLARVKNLIEQRKQLRKKFSAGVVLKPGEVAVTSIDDALLKKVMSAIEKNIGDENFSVEDLARVACLSQRHLGRKVHALTNLKPSELIQYVRLQRARDLLEKNAGSIAEIAYQVGFGSPSYFSSCFNERFGYPPSEVRV